MSTAHQPAAARRHAVPLVPPVKGLPLIKGTPTLGRMLEWRRGRVTVDCDMPIERKKRAVFDGMKVFLEWMRKEDRAEYRGKAKVYGPYPHFNAQPPSVQVGDRGGKRLVARQVAQDLGGDGKEDYVIEALFSVPEYINEVPTELAQRMFSQSGGRPGLRPLRDREWKKRGAQWLPR